MFTGSVVIGEKPIVLSALCEPHVRMAVWTRPNPAPADAAFPTSLGMTCDGHWIEVEEPAPVWLMDDLQRLGEIFCIVSGETGWQARFETVTDRACPRLHEDATPLRMITTYLGPGTEWLFASEAADDLDVRKASTRARLRTVAPGAVALIKGSKALRAEDDALVLHRSPAASRARPRHVCVIDRPAHAPPQVELSEPNGVTAPLPRRR